MKKLGVIGTRRESAGPPNGPNMDRLDREAIKQEIRELDSLRFVESNEFSAHYSEFVYHRINELLEMLDNEE